MSNPALIIVDPTGTPLAQSVVSTLVTAPSAKVAASTGIQPKIAKSVASMRIGTTQDITQSSAPAKALSSMMDPLSFHCNFQRPLPNKHQQRQFRRSRRHTLTRQDQCHLHQLARTRTTPQWCDPTLLMQATSILRLMWLPDSSDSSRRKNNRSSLRKLPTTSAV